MTSIYIGSDHAGLELKQKLKEHLQTKAYHVVDLGVFKSEPADYPDIAHEVAEKVRENSGARGILVCGTGIGMCMAANKTAGVRAVNPESEQTAEMARKHNDANILCLGVRVISEEKAKKLVDIFMETEFEKEERHERRVKKIDKVK